MRASTTLPHDVAARFGHVIRRAALRVARRLPSHVCVDDLVGAGYVGLVDAYRRFDPAGFESFEPYAEVRIKGAMLDELRSYDPLSRGLRALATRTARATQRLENQLGRRPLEHEIASELGVSLDVFQKNAGRMAVGTTRSTDEESSPEAADVGSRNAEQTLADSQGRRALADAVSSLPERLGRILALYYRDELTLRDIGLQMNVTESRICQLHAEAIKRLRVQLSLSEPDARRMLHGKASNDDQSLESSPMQLAS